MPGLAVLAGTALKKKCAKLLKRLAGAYAVRLQGFSIASDRFHLILPMGARAGGAVATAGQRLRV